MQQYIAGFDAIVDEALVWAMSDDNVLCRFYLNGQLIHSEPSTSLDSVPPWVTPGSSISVLNKLQGFGGGNPDWSNTFYQGQLDELRMFIGHAIYTGDSYDVAAEPFTLP